MLVHDCVLDDVAVEEPVLVIDDVLVAVAEEEPVTD